MRSIKNFLSLATASITILAVQACSQPEMPPNIVLIMADDIGQGDLSYYRKLRTDDPPVFRTTNLDYLAAEGMLFTDAHSPASLCAPTRFSMLTGNFSYRNKQPWGVWTPWADARIEPEFTTIARIAKAGGYHTSFFGKWGLGGIWNGMPEDFSKTEAGALYYGFDYAVELPQGIQNKPYVYYENGKWMKIKPGSVLMTINVEQTGYRNTEENQIRRSGVGDSNWDPSLAGPTLAGKAVSHIQQLTKDHPGEPFFMYYCSQAVHVPHAPPSELDEKNIAGATPDKHGDMILELDTQIGMIIRALKEVGVYENTLIVFTSDNGGLTHGKELIKGGHVTSNGYRGHKGSIYEGGHRVPFIAVWPGKIKPGSSSDIPIVSQDMVATLAAITGKEINRNQIRDSGNLLPYFLGETTDPLHKYIAHQSGAGPSYALREGDWKLIMLADLPPEVKNYREYENRLMPLVPTALFNLEENPGEDETRNLVNDPEHAERVKDMMATYRRIRESQEATIFTH